MVKEIKKLYKGTRANRNVTWFTELSDKSKL